MPEDMQDLPGNKTPKIIECISITLPSETCLLEVVSLTELFSMAVRDELYIFNIEEVYYIITHGIVLFYQNGEPKPNEKNPLAH